MTYSRKSKERAMRKSGQNQEKIEKSQLRSGKSKGGKSQEGKSQKRVSKE